jgi:hypothetical protein
MASKTKISHPDLKKKLQGGSLKFYFRKVGGELREAIGTLDLNRIPNANHPKGGKVSGTQTAYYDLEKGAWRSVSETQEIWVD